MATLIVEDQKPFDNKNGLATKLDCSGLKEDVLLLKKDLKEVKVAIIKWIVVAGIVETALIVGLIKWL